MKWDAEVVERVLLRVAGEIGRFPRKNLYPGKSSFAARSLSRFGSRTLRIGDDGFDPLLLPEPPCMKGTKTITLR